MVSYVLPLWSFESHIYTDPALFTIKFPSVAAVLSSQPCNIQNYELGIKKKKKDENALIVIIDILKSFDWNFSMYTE